MTFEEYFGDWVHKVGITPLLSGTKKSNYE